MEPNCFLIGANCVFEKNFIPQLVSFCPNDTTVSFGVVEVVVVGLLAGKLPLAKYIPAITISAPAMVNPTFIREPVASSLMEIHLH